ncbi:MAG: histidine phosphatase family protein [Steroidobacteraceae bacterium]
MRRLTLLRHAHAIDALPGQSDFDRSLSAAGGASAVSAAGELAAAVPPPDLLLYSPALRTSQTAASVRLNAFPKVRSEESRALYLATTEQLLAEIADLRDTDEHVLLVGHNPGISTLCARLTEERGFSGFAPAGWASLLLPIDGWNGILLRNARAQRA